MGGGVDEGDVGSKEANGWLCVANCKGTVCCSVLGNQSDVTSDPCLYFSCLMNISS